MIYSFLFVLAGLASFIVQFYLGRKRQIPAVPLALALTGSLMLFMIFLKLPFFGLDLSAQQITSVRYMMTGALGTVVGTLAARYILRIGFDRLDDAALVFPLVLVLTKLGCFFAGCCFGIPGGGVLGIRYEALSPAYIFYLGEGSHSHSLMLHPVQLYEAAGGLVILVAMWLMRNRWKQPGSAFFFLLVAYLPLRILAEFFRASDTPLILSGLKVVHIVSFAFWIVALLLLRQNERASFFKRQFAVTRTSTLMYFFVSEVVLFASMASYLHFIERVVVIAALLFSALLLLRHLIQGQRPAYSLRQTLIIPAAVTVIMISTGQAIPDTVSYRSVQFGVSTGKYVNTYSEGDGCASISQNYNQKYTMVGIGYSSFKKRGRTSSELGITAFGGGQSETPLDPLNTTGEKRFGTFGIHGYGKWDEKWAGIGAGLNVGNLRYAEDRFVDNLGTTGYITAPLMPSFYIRVGPKRFLFAEYKFADAFPSSSPGYMQQFAIGSGFGSKNGFEVSIGAVKHFGTSFNFAIPFPTASEGIIKLGYVHGNFYPSASSSSGQRAENRQLQISYTLHLRPKGQ